MAFTTWSTLYQKMLDDLAGGNTTHGSYKMGEREINFKSNADFLRMLEYVKIQADAESGASVGRTYAKNGRR